MRRSLRLVAHESLSQSAPSVAAKAPKKRVSKEWKKEVEEIKPTKRTKTEGTSAKDFTVKPEPKPKVKAEATAEPKLKTEVKAAAKMTSKKAAKDAAKEAEKSSQNAAYLDFLMKRRHDTAATNKVVGAHVSGAGGLENAVFNAAKIGARAFALFTRSQRTWTCKPMEAATAEAFQAAMKAFGYTPNDVVPHGSYLLNCGSPDAETLRKSREGLLDEVRRCEQLGLSLYNFHPGSTKKEISVDACLDLIAESIELTLAQTHGVTILIENMSSQGSTVGGQFSELKGIIGRISDAHRSRVGVCLDTCHAFAAGWDLRDEDAYEATMRAFDETVGLQYLKAVHLNDSKGDLGCHADRHEKIGKGKIGLEPFRRLMNDPRFDGIPMVLETPYVDDDGYEEEISLLYALANEGKAKA
ncbi:Aste57867_13697 [Aphanomyces stellatus]|uniref:Aste57867_13697 protein n=1 Tax=Aphanomyces stellatus TaxID=120398 RepID=A0A485L0H8_9STRA|nr:hypothetical protein As57867_013647 [Aphanomyces stellatus]VFT90530.1 Aste57867_13697 [Aphanomyces stellatus]